MTAEPAPTGLPPLDEPCPHCTGPEAQAANAAARKVWAAWDHEESRAYRKFADANPYAGYDQWKRTPEYRALAAREPEIAEHNGCVECDWIGRRMTAAGRAILDLLSRYYHPKG